MYCRDEEAPSSRISSAKMKITGLLAASLQRRRGAKPISCWSRYTIFGLLSVTGMRVSEAVNLDLEDVDLDQGVLTIRCGFR
jgi:integrase